MDSGKIRYKDEPSASDALALRKFVPHILPYNTLLQFSHWALGLMMNAKINNILPCSLYLIFAVCLVSDCSLSANIFETLASSF